MTLYRCDLDPRTGRDRYVEATPEEVAEEAGVPDLVAAAEERGRSEERAAIVAFLLSEGQRCATAAHGLDDDDRRRAAMIHQAAAYGLASTDVKNGVHLIERAARAEAPTLLDAARGRDPDGTPAEGSYAEAPDAGREE